MALADLLRPRTRPQVVNRMLQVLAAARGEVNPSQFAPTSYVPGDPLRTVLEITGEGIADTERTLEGLGLGGYLQTAQGAWLDALVESHYGLTRQQSTFAAGWVQFTAPLTEGIGIPAGMIVGTVSGLRFTTRDPLVLAAGASGQVLATAESPGAEYNVPLGTITVIHTPLPGLTVTNPPGWLVTNGADTESDESLRERARLRWAELGRGGTAAAYRYWALTAGPGVDRVRVLDQHPRGQGTVDVVIWGTGGIGSQVVADTNAFIQQQRPLTANVQVYAATERVLPVTLELYAPGMDRPTIEAQVHAGLAELQRATDIGGRLYTSQLIEVAMLPAGVMDVRSSVGDVILGPTEALTLLPRLTWRETP